MLTTDEQTAADRLGRRLVAAMPPYAGLPEQHRGRWLPSPTSTDAPWVAHLQAYVWEGQGIEEVQQRFLELGRQLREQGGARYSAASEIFTWGFPGRRFELERSAVDAVVRTACALSCGDTVEIEQLGPWSAYWTKVACASTIDMDLASPGMPQAIWDSRVVTATCLLLEQSDALTDDLTLARAILKVPQARANSGLNRRAFAGARRGWRLCYGTTSVGTRWKSQALGSRLLSSCARELSRMQAGGRGDWTSFEVGAALFVEGY